MLETITTYEVQCQICIHNNKMLSVVIFIDVLVSPILETIERVKSLEQQMDDLELYNRTWCVPETMNGNKTAVFVNTVNQHLDNESISYDDIENLHRISKRTNGKIRPIIVRFYS
ncbi:unnamed protein product [Didymodactylos carnosus]|uniref:Uncharacterized protein n=1 Tax=Didymodactylos carnosus TaxID=1234261 RepID=A0A814YXS8_9BILA|nr:unnamed protein product [Didymodactylos carnosus]CAF3998537.1 unnamed protein product [Didymodactylos carnosus]